MAESDFEKGIKNRDSLHTCLGVFSLAEVSDYSNGGKTYFYTKDDMAILIDVGICNSPDDRKLFSYSKLTDKQNQYMHRFQKVYRFVSEDLKHIDDTLTDQGEDTEYSRRQNDRANRSDASPLELKFEESFSNVYGKDSSKYLWKEYGITDGDGKTKYFDYFLHSKDGDYAIEENGVNYHHPQMIGLQRYREQLQKQNICTNRDIKLFRFSSEDCRFTDRIEDDIKSFLGSDASRFEERGLLVDRPVVLYDHQKMTLEDIRKQRAKGIKSFLVVFPTASGKSKIVEEDIQYFAQERHGAHFLILVPNTAVQDDWSERIAHFPDALQENITIRSYAYMERHYTEYSQEEYQYIVVDEAHHAVAPGLKRTIQYFIPEFLIGLTATDERPDQKKLEAVFGSYHVGLSLSESMEKGIIARANAFRIETNIDLSQVRINGRDYVNADLEKSVRVTSRNDLIVDVLKEYFCDGTAAHRQGIVFCVNVKHAEEMERLLNKAGISARAYSSKSKHPDDIMADFKAKKIRFLCTCQMISEGWDYPELGILIMARPTLSKVLYLQQLGRGLRKTSTKQNVFVIDVVDEYGSMVQPCSLHSIFHNPYYVPFGDIINRSYQLGEMITVDGLQERIERIVEIDISSFDEKYGDYVSEEQLAREFFVNTGTIRSWIQKKRIVPTVSFPFGNKKLNLFSREDMENIRREMKIPIHNDDTIRSDFFAFLEERDYSLSYKMPFLISFINHMDDSGAAVINDVLDDYIAFYQNRLDHGLMVDRKTCPFTLEMLKDRKAILRNMLTNPFEKFERKRFLYYSKDLSLISMNHALYSTLSASDKKQVISQMKADLEDYYRKLEK